MNESCLTISFISGQFHFNVHRVVQLSVGAQFLVSRAKSHESKLDAVAYECECLIYLWNNVGAYLEKQTKGRTDFLETKHPESLKVGHVLLSVRDRRKVASILAADSRA